MKVPDLRRGAIDESEPALIKRLKDNGQLIRPLVEPGQSGSVHCCRSSDWLD
jgi:hypothetical protein